jgi:hypothetical protein
MKVPLAAWSVLCVVVIVVAASQSGEPPEAARAREVAQTLLNESRALLMKEISALGPAGALQECSAVALDLAKKHEGDGWRIRRVSDRLRNPADAPDKYETAVLASFAAKHSKGALGPDTEQIEVVTGNDGKHLRYMRPITIAGALCLKCHGGAGEIAPDVQARIRQLYPADRATGYRLNDLRGAVSIRIPMR